MPLTIFWSQGTVSKKNHAFKWPSNILLQLLHLKLFPNNKLWWGGDCLPLPSSFHGQGEGDRSSATDRRKTCRQNTCLVSSLDPKEGWFSWQVTWRYQLSHSLPLSWEVPRLEVQPLHLLGMTDLQDAASFCFSYCVNKTRWFGHVFANVELKRGV